MVNETTTGLAFDSRHAQVENEIPAWPRRAPRRAPRRGASEYSRLQLKIVPAGPVRGILQGGHQVFSTILMYTEKRGRGTILVAIESTVDCARSPYGESTFKRNRPSFAVLMVLGGGGGGGGGQTVFSSSLSP